MKTYLVAGGSVAGVAAALEFMAQGHQAHLILCGWDNLGLEDSYLIGPTPLNDHPVRGTAFADLAFEHLGGAGVKFWSTDPWLGNWDQFYVDAVSEELVLDDRWDDTLYRFSGAVFAPAGVGPGLAPEIEGPVRWRGLSYSAWSDAPFFRGKPVVVVGCGYRAYEQAQIAAEFASSVTLLCKDRGTGPLGLLEQAVARTSCLSVRVGAEVLGLQPDDTGALAMVVVRENGREVRLAASGAFVAHNPVVPWRVWNSQEDALSLRDRGKLTFAGIAAGVPFSDHAALYASGVRAARECLAANARRD